MTPYIIRCKGRRKASHALKEREQGVKIHNRCGGFLLYSDVKMEDDKRIKTTAIYLRYEANVHLKITQHVVNAAIL